jgi:hypothetical protein
VYLDWLADHGDARAKAAGRSRGPLPELPGILRGIPGRAAWLGSLNGVADVRSCRFVDGVLETLTLSDAPKKSSEPLKDPRLATVKELRLVHGSAAKAVWSSGRLSSLQRLTGPADVLDRLGHGGPQERLDRVHLLASPRAQLVFDLPPARQLLLGYSAATGAQVNRRLRLDPNLVAELEDALPQVGPRRKYAEVGVEVPDAPVEGIASWLALSAMRGAVHFVVHGGSVISLDAEARRLSLSPHTTGKPLLNRLLVASMLLRELADIPLRTVEVEGPHRLEGRLRKVHELLLLECRRRGDVTALRMGGTTVVP